MGRIRVEADESRYHPARKGADVRRTQTCVRAGAPLRKNLKNLHGRERNLAAAARPTGAPSGTPGGWKSIDWTKADKFVRRLQVRIAKAVGEGKPGKVKALQRMLTRSYAARVLAVRRVTSNKGKRTAGVDGILWSTPRQKMLAVDTLHRHGYRPQPLRRIYIPKKNGKKRPLSIPTMRDRAMQALYKMALEPVAETLTEAAPMPLRNASYACRSATLPAGCSKRISTPVLTSSAMSGC